VALALAAAGGRGRVPAALIAAVAAVFAGAVLQRLSGTGFSLVAAA
jgi:hypothetical protein